MVNQNKLEQLLTLFAEGKISREEYERLFVLFEENPDDESFNAAIDQTFRKTKNYSLMNDDEVSQLYQNITEDSRFAENYSFSNRFSVVWKQVSIAASILILLSTALYFYTNREPQNLVSGDVVKKSEIAEPIIPGGDKAVLTLSDGSQIILDNAKNGVLANQAGVSVQKTSDGKLLYTFSNSPNASSGDFHENVIYNKVETPPGGKYQVNLPDGSTVWLNASSSLRFPAMFSGDTREVELTGEAYFDVAKNKNKPFKVITKDQIVEVLGTQFNINSYADEGAIKTTLIEGSVKIIYKDKVVLLTPGQQYQPKTAAAKVVEADTEEVIAWKNGYFLFKNEGIQSIMRKLSRWYNVEISYSGQIPEVGFGGNISRSKDISEVLNVLQLTNAVHFKVEGRRIIVMQ